MTVSTIRLISFDVGGTLTDISGTPISAILISLSPRPEPVVREVLRRTLQVAPQVTGSLIKIVCVALAIDPAQFPKTHPPARARLVSSAMAVTELSTVAPVVTLSNVSPMDVDERDEPLVPGLAAQYPSYRIGYAKPDPRAFETVASRHDTPVAQVVHIGDDWECDVLGAARAGAHAVWLSHGRRTPFLPEDGSARRITVVPDLASAVRHVRQVVGPAGAPVDGPAMPARRGR